MWDVITRCKPSFERKENKFVQSFLAAFVFDSPLAFQRKSIDVRLTFSGRGHHSENAAVFWRGDGGCRTYLIDLK